MKGKAAAIWQNMLNEENLFGDGRRNDDAVNFCVVCKVLGKDVNEAYREMQCHHWENELDRSKNKINLDFLVGREHIDRVCNYLDYWCPTGDEERGFDYTINSSAYMQVS